MITRGEKIRLGIFLATALAILLVTIALLIGVKLWSPHDVYYARFRESVSGLERGAPVKLSGVRVGRVEDIRIDAEDITAVMVSLSLRQGTPVRDDSVAMIGAQGITGLKYVELTRGTSGARLLDPGSEINTKESIVGELTGRAADIAVKTEILVNNLLAISDADSRQHMANILARLDSLLTRTDKLIERNADPLSVSIGNAEEITTSLKGSMETMDAILSDNRIRITQLMDNLNLTAEETRVGLNQILSNLNTTVEELRVNLNLMTSEFRGMLSSIIDPEKLNQTIEDLDEVLKRAGDQIGDRGIVLAIKNMNGILYEVQEIVEGLNRTFDLSRENIYVVTENLKESTENLNELSRALKNNPSLLLSSPRVEEREVP